MAAASLQMHLQHSPRKKNFGYEETIRLLELWTHYTNGGTHPELGKGHRTGRLWLVISERMKAMGYNRGPEECKVRVGNLRAKYTKLKRSYLAGEGVPDWPYYPVLAKFLEGRGDYDNAYETGSHSFTEAEARPGASHHHPGMFLSMSMEEANEPLSVDVSRRVSSYRSNDESSVSMADSASSAGSEPNEAAPNGHMASAAEALPPLPQIKRRPLTPIDDLRRSKKPKTGTSSVLLSLMQAMLKIEEEHLKLQQERAASEAAMMQAVTAFFSNMSQMFGAHLPSSTFSKGESSNANTTGTVPGNPVSSKTPSNPSSSCSNSPAYSHSYSNPMGSAGLSGKMHLDSSSGNQIPQQTAGHHFPYGSLNQAGASPSSAQMASPAAYPMSPAYQQGMMGNNASATSGGGSWYNNASGSAKAAGNIGGSMTPTSASMVAHSFSSDMLGISKSRHDAM